MYTIKGIYFLIKNFFFALNKSFIDFFFVTFDVNKPLPENALNSLFDALNILDDLKIKYFITDGTILGIYRDKNLISHDNDLDIALIDDKKLFILSIALIKSGWLPIRFMAKDFHIYQLIFYKKKVILDFCNWKRKSDDIVFLAPEINGIRLQNMKYYKPTTYYINGRSYLSHSFIEEWLQIHYGKDWNIPKKFKGDWREDTNDIIEN